MAIKFKKEKVTIHKTNRLFPTTVFVAAAVVGISYLFFFNFGGLNITVSANKYFCEKYTASEEERKRHLQPQRPIGFTGYSVELKYSIILVFKIIYPRRGLS